MDGAIFLLKSLFIVGSMLFSTKVFKKVYEFRLEVDIIFDQDLLFRCAFYFPIYVIDSCTMFYHKTRQTITYAYEEDLITSNFQCLKNLFFSLSKERKYLCAKKAKVLFLAHKEQIIASYHTYYVNLVAQEKFKVINEINDLLNFKLMGMLKYYGFIWYAELSKDKIVSPFTESFSMGYLSFFGVKVKLFSSPMNKEVFVVNVERSGSQQVHKAGEILSKQSWQYA